MSTYNQLMHQYQRIFRENLIPEETVRVFLFELCSEYGVNMYLQLDEEVKPEIYERFVQGCKRLLNNEPLNYVLGYSWFYGYKLEVNDDVLIPRPETEELVARVLSMYDEHFKGKEVRVCDVGTGSGAIAIALKKEEPKMEVYASDISEAALKVAERNAASNDCAITFLQGSMLEPYIEQGLKFDILVSNPPYIRSDEDIEASVKDFEPHVALFGGSDGLKFYRDIFAKAQEILLPESLLFFEMGYDQKDRLTALAKEYFPKREAIVYKDINNKDRILMIC